MPLLYPVFTKQKNNVRRNAREWGHEGISIEGRPDISIVIQQGAAVLDFHGWVGKSSRPWVQSPSQDERESGRRQGRRDTDLPSHPAWPPRALPAVYPPAVPRLALWPRGQSGQRP